MLKYIIEITSKIAEHV